MGETKLHLVLSESKAWKKESQPKNISILWLKHPISQPATVGIEKEQLLGKLPEPKGSQHDYFHFWKGKQMIHFITDVFF